MPAPDPDAETVLLPIARRVAERPQAIAVRCEGAQLDYRSLWHRAGAIAAELHARGCQPEERVGILLPRCIDLVPALLGTVLAGYCYVPLEPTYPLELTRWMIADAGIVRILCLGAPPVGLRDLVEAIDLTQPLLAAVAGREWIGPRPDQLVYTLYTSGSTGRPKGAMNTHAALLNRLRWMQQAYALAPDERVLQKTPFTFDVSVWEFFWPLMVGACQVLAAPEGHRDFAYLAGLIASEGITRVHFVPSMLEGFLAACGSRVLPSLRQIVCSGEALPTPVAERCLAVFPHATVDNLYGPTEAAIDVSFHRCGMGETTPSQPIGVAIAGIDLHVLDERMRPVADGRPGELFIGGVGLARGYLGRPALTAERFVAHPLATRPGERLYRTGDLASRRSDGVIDFLGRLDFQVKINGQRIELGEIENVLRDHADVAAAVVTDRVGDGGRRYLAGYVTLKPGAALRRASADRMTRTWRELYEQVYAGFEAARVEPRDNFLSWNSSFDGEPLPLAAMHAWADETASRISAAKPRRVFEIGCGSGLLVSRLAATVDEYVGIDPSPAALDYLGARLPRAEREHVRLLEGYAHAMPAAVGQGFDMAVLNSVVQYFPDAEYLADVLDRCVDKMLGGRLFIGDVRDARLQSGFAACLAVSAGDAPRAGRDRRLAQETELLLDPVFFLDWASRQPRVSACELLPKTADYANEIACYRYDVVIHLDRAPVVPAMSTLDWCDLPDWDALSERAAGEPGLAVAVTGVPLPRLHAALSFNRLLDGQPGAGLDEWQQLSDAAPVGQDPAALDRLLATRGQRAEWRLEPDLAGLYRVAILPRDAAPLLWPAATLGNAGIAPAPRVRTELSQDASAILKPFLAQRLPAYMLPAHLLVLDAMPLNHSGKIDRKALPSPLLLASSDAGVQSPAISPTQRTLATIWCALLQRESVGIDQSFYRLGGDSILLAQMVMRAADEGLRISLGRAIACSTIDTLAAAIDELGDEGEDGDEVGIAQGFGAEEQARLIAQAAHTGIAVERVVPLPDFIAGMLIQSQHGAAEGTNGELVSFEADALDPQAFARAWNAVIQRHEILRSSFSFLLPGRPAQIIHRMVDWSPQWLDWRGDDVATQEARWRQLYRQAWQRRLAPDVAPMMHVNVVRLDQRRSRVLWFLHHALTDGWSYALVLKDLLNAYRGDGLQAPPPGYSEVSSWLRGNEQSLALQRYWAGYLAGFEVAEGRLPATLQTGGRPDVPVLCRTAKLAAAPRASLDRSLRAANVTWNALIEVVWGTCLARDSGRDRIAFGSLASIRSTAVKGMAEVVGPLFNVLPVRFDAAAASGLPLLEQVRRHLATRALHADNAHAHPGLFRRAAGLPADASLFESVVVFENIPSVAADPMFGQLRFDSRSDKPLVMLVWPGAELRLELYADAIRFSESWLEARLQVLIDVLERLSANSDLRIADCLPGPSVGWQGKRLVVEMEF